jgi:hypothetical protein
MQPQNPPSLFCGTRAFKARRATLLISFMLLSVLAISVQAQAPQPVSTRTFKAMCGGFQSSGKDLFSQCTGNVEFIIPSEAELKSGKRPTVRMTYGSDKQQVWELGEPKDLPNPSVAMINITKVDGKPGEGYCIAQSYPHMQSLEFLCYSYVPAEGAASNHSFNVTISNAPGGNATGPLDELLDYFKGVSALLGGRPLPTPPNPSAATPPAPAAVAAPSAAKPTTTPGSDNASNAQNKPGPKAAADPFKPSNDPKAIFGLMVGKPGPKTLPHCKYKDAFSLPTFAPNQLYCLSEVGTGLNALLGGLKEDLAMNDYQQLGIAPISIGINDQVYDTRITENVTVFFDRNSVILRVKIDTFLVSHDDVLKMLLNKYGKATKEGWSTWTNPQTGAEVDRTPNYYWDFPGIFVDYISRTANLFNTKTPKGSIDVFTAEYSRMVGDYLKKRDAPPPGRKPM